MKTICLLLISIIGYAPLLKSQSTELVPENIKTNKQILEGFMDKRFGMFIHWGPVTLRGTEIGWSRNHEVEQADYDSLYKEFDPVLFNADAWVKTAHDAGMKYITITAKHHDGFCLWPTAYTEYNIMNSPFKKDLVGELAKACKKYDIKFCIYYTILDWYSPDYPLHNDGRKDPDPKADMPRFVRYMKNQLKELITYYHPYMLWFDGNWETPWTQAMAVDMYGYLKKLEPELIINNRLGKQSHEEMVEGSVGDYATPEQKIGKLAIAYPWESCITICNQWAWKPNDKMKSLKECIQTLCSTAGGNGNLLFNVGPMMDGRMEKRQVERLKEIGDWLKTYGEAIYSTKGGPFAPDSVMAFTRKGNKMYLLLFKKDLKSLTLPAIPERKLQRAYFMGGKDLNIKQSKQNITVNLPDMLPNENCSVIVMEMDGDMEKVPVQSK